MNIVFLDIDGVLNSAQWFEHFPTPGKWDLDPVLVKRVNAIVETADASIVISSNWRVHMRPQHLVDLLEKQGLYPHRIVGMTPRLFNGTTIGPRGPEIAEWLKRDQDRTEKFVILDDRDDMGNLIPFLVQTNGEIGITDTDVDRAISMLT